MKIKAAFLWDESFLWGLMAYDALMKNRLPFDLIRSEDIKNKCIHDYKMLFVPGGWASNKFKALGDEGIEEIKNFIANGGRYLGICGGAGLATLDGIGLLDIKRRPTKDRVPSFSGRIKLKINQHPLWMRLESKTFHTITNSLDKEPIFHAWWPSQFKVDDNNINTLAFYGEALPDAFTSDLCIGDIIYNNGDWHQLESSYGINLNPSRLYGEPAVVEGSYGNGKVILSLIHFDTPDDVAGQLILKTLWEYLLEDNFEYIKPDNYFAPESIHTKHRGKCQTIINEIFNIVTDLMNFGTRNFLWFKRNTMLYQWRRGIRGLEYCNLYILIKKISEIYNLYSTDLRKIVHLDDEFFYHKLLSIRELLLPFCEKAQELLILERIALQNGHITYEKCNDPKIQSIRSELFSTSKSYGGAYKKLINKIDYLLYNLIKSKN